MDEKQNLSGVIESTSKPTENLYTNNIYKIWSKPMEDESGEFFIADKEIVSVYQNGLKNKWNPTQCVYEICTQCNWKPPQYIQFSFSDKEGAVFDVIVNKMLFRSKKCDRNMRIAKHLASATFLKFLGFEFSYNDNDKATQTSEIPSNTPGLYSKSYLERMRTQRSNIVSKTNGSACRSACCALFNSRERNNSYLYSNRSRFSREHPEISSPESKKRTYCRGANRGCSGSCSPSDKRRRVTYCSDISRVYSRESSPRGTRRRTTYVTETSRVYPQECRRCCRKRRTSCDSYSSRSNSRDQSPSGQKRITNYPNEESKVNTGQSDSCNNRRRMTNETNSKCDCIECRK